MSHAKRGFKMLGLSSFAALGLMAFGAAGTQAVTWDVNGVETAGNVSVTGNIVAGTTILILVPVQNVVVHCTGFTVTEGTLRTENTVHINLIATGCTTKVKGVESPGCKPEVLPLNAKAKPILHGGRVLLLAEPLTAGSSFTTIHYNEETCALPELPIIKGSVALECYTGTLVEADCKTSRAKHLIRPVVNQALHGDALIYGLNPMVLDVEAELFLIAPLWNALI